MNTPKEFSIMDMKALDRISGYNKQEEEREREYVDAVISSIKIEAKEKGEVCFL